MVRIMKIMTEGMKDAKGTSFMEDYTYNLAPGKEGILQAHMLEVCPTIADGPVSIKVKPLSMGDRRIRQDWCLPPRPERQSPHL